MNRRICGSNQSNPCNIRQAESLFWEDCNSSLMHRHPSTPSEVKSQTNPYCVRCFIVYVTIYEQAPIATYTTKATQMSGFVCDFVSLVGVDGFEPPTLCL